MLGFHRAGAGGRHRVGLLGGLGEGNWWCGEVVVLEKGLEGSSVRNKFEGRELFEAGDAAAEDGASGTVVFGRHRV